MLTYLFTKFFGKELSESRWIYLADLFALFLAFLLPLVLTRNLTIEEFGLLALTVAIGEFISLFLEIKVCNVLTRYLKMAIHNKESRSVWQLILWGFKWNIAIMVLIFLALFFVSPHIIALYKSFQPVAVFIKIYAFVALGRIGSDVALGILQTMSQFKIIGATRILRAVLRFMLASLLVQKGIIGVLIGYALANGIFSMVILFLALYKMKQTFPFKWVRPILPHHWRKEIVKMTLSITGSLSIKGMLGHMDIIFLGIFSSASSVALYRIAKSGALMITSLVGPMSDVLYPQFVSSFIQKQYAEYKRLIRIFIEKALLLLIPIATLLYFFAPWIIGFLYPQKYLLCVPLFRVMLIGYFFISLAAWGKSFVFSIGKAHYSTIWNGLRLVLVTILFLVIVPRYGVFGASVSIMSIEILITLIIFYLSMISFRRIRATL